MKAKHLILLLVIFTFAVITGFNYLSRVFDSKRLEKIQLMQEKIQLTQQKIDTEIVESYLTSQISKLVEI
jgi:hypothetical protein